MFIILHFLISPSQICGGQIGIGTVFPSVSVYQCFAYQFIHPPTALHSLSNWQHCSIKHNIKN